MMKVPKVYIIAEAGVNHNGDIKEALRLVDLAHDSGADAVKFQTFKASGVATADAQKASYQKKTVRGNGNQLEMLKKLELDEAAHRCIIARCRQKKIDFLSTPFDMASVELLLKLGMKTFKVPSGEITNVPYLRKIAAVAQRIILSTGMANMDEIIFARDILMKTGFKNEDLTILHCNTEYPTPLQDVNLRAMLTIKERLKVKIGYSDHTVGIAAALAATALGAELIEKHLTSNRHQEGPDHKASLEPSEFKAMAQWIREVQLMLGDGIKLPSPSEKKNIVIARRSIVALHPIQKGEIFTEENLTTKRPAKGLSPIFWDQVMGKHAKRDFAVDERILL